MLIGVFWMVDTRFWAVMTTSVTELEASFAGGVSAQAAKGDTIAEPPNRAATSILRFVVIAVPYARLPLNLPSAPHWATARVAHRSAQV
jgi:hypothetical protein